MTTRWGLADSMIKHLFEQREPIEELGLLPAEIHILLAMWSDLEDICSGLEIFLFYFFIFISIFILLTRRKATEALYIG